MVMGSPEVRIPLTPFDHCVPRAYYNGAIYLSIRPGVTFTEAFAVLHEALHRTFVTVPWLSGKVHLQSSDSPGWRPGQGEIRYCPVDVNDPWPHQFKFKELESSVSFDEIKDAGFPTDTFNDDDLVWSPFFADLSSTPEVFVGQANFIPGCCIITAAIHHSASDETAFFHVLKLWSGNCNALQRESKRLAEMSVGSSDRSVPDRLWTRERTGENVDEIDPQTWMLIGISPSDIHQEPVKASTSAAAHAPPPKSTLRAQQLLKAGIFYVSPSGLSALQRDIAQELGGSGGISSNDAVCALIWRCFLRARSMARKASGNSSEESGEADAVLNMVCDGRPNFSTGLPPKYLGNITFNVLSKLPLPSLTSTDTSIATVAATIRRGASSIGSAHLMDLYTLLQNLSGFDDLARWKRNRTSSIEGNNMAISSMIMFPVSDVNFGDRIFGNRGMVEAIRPFMDGLNRFTRICFVLPRNKNGSVEFVANLFDEEMDILMEDEEFANYATCLSWA
ncbi:conserved hypothetical protein [Talaromyces marneffei ATCC 18224]|uniref:Trichothecene 3-O-acetyltransferase-like N-terminal domain-containing protein n=2 Tax=Talaromyces marneffei TaxID=37727 RepID=B6QJC4_TALMQ|nr:conserved hypothetical protein [Talaromyces marneffei ATCC 18224]